MKYFIYLLLLLVSQATSQSNKDNDRKAQKITEFMNETLFRKGRLADYFEATLSGIRLQYSQHLISKNKVRHLIRGDVPANYPRSHLLIESSGYVRNMIFEKTTEPMTGFKEWDSSMMSLCPRHMLAVKIEGKYNRTDLPTPFYCPILFSFLHQINGWTPLDRDNQQSLFFRDLQKWIKQMFDLAQTHPNTPPPISCDSQARYQCVATPEDRYPYRPTRTVPDFFMDVIARDYDNPLTDKELLNGSPKCGPPDKKFEDELDSITKSM